jgi:hypothetical protein
MERERGSHLYKNGISWVALGGLISHWRRPKDLSGG